MGRPGLDAYFSIVPRAVGRRAGRLRFELAEVFRGIDFRGRTVLDIGAGPGTASFYAACAGAARVVALEPTAAGSSPGVRETFERTADALDAANVELAAASIQQFDPGGERFDLLVSIASINHLDEEAAQRLHEDSGARSVYMGLAAKLASLTASGGTLVVCDCARRNLFAALRMPNPIVPTIEWHKHQSPELWAEILGQAGFRDPLIRWNAYNALRPPGFRMPDSRAVAFALTSGFCLTMER